MPEPKADERFQPFCMDGKGAAGRIGLRQFWRKVSLLPGCLVTVTSNFSRSQSLAGLTEKQFVHAEQLLSALFPGEVPADTLRQVRTWRSCQGCQHC